MSPTARRVPSRTSAAITRLASAVLPRSWLAALAARAGYSEAPAQNLVHLLHSGDQPMRFRSAEDEDRNGIYPLQVYAETQWDPRQRDEAMHQGDAGIFRRIALMIDAMRSDGLISGIGGTISDGLTRLDGKWAGDPYLVDRLRGRAAKYDADGTEIEPRVPGDLEWMMNGPEASAVIWDGMMGGYGLGELVPQADGSPPRLQHLDLHWVRYWYTTDQYHYTTSHGSDLIIEPGNGRFVEYTPYGRRRPWARGKWWPLGLPFIQNQNAAFDRLRWHRDLADDLKVLQANAGADEKHRDGLIEWLKRGWRRSPGLVTPPGFEAKLIGSTGKGYEVYKQGEESAAISIQLTLAGQLVTATGTSGLGGKADLWDRIEAGRVTALAEPWAYTVNRDFVQPYCWGLHRVPRRACPVYSLDARSPAARAAEAQALKQAAEAFSSVQAMLERVEPDSTLDLDAALAEQGLAIPRKQRAFPIPAEPPSNVFPMRRVA